MVVIIEPRYRESTRPTNPFKTYREKPAKTKGLAPVGKRGRENAPKDAEWSLAVRDLWSGRCIITQEDRPDHLHAHHCYDKSYRPAWRHELWNGIVLESWTIHPLCDTNPVFHGALEQVALNQRARMETGRPLLTRVEARGIIFDLCPEVRKYARPEVET